MYLVQSSRRRKVAARLEVERLESRTVLSTFVWSNRGTCIAAPCGGTTDSDMYFARFGANAAAARNVTDAVLAAWGNIIQEFNYTNVGQQFYAPQANTYFLIITGAALGTGILGQTSFNNIDPTGKPFRASIRMDDNAAGTSWYFDPEPYDHAEFVTVQNRFGAARGPSGYDFYATLSHEVGHAVGIAIGNGLRINQRITNPGFPPPQNVLRVFNYLDGSQMLMTTDGGGHLYPGPSVGGLPVAPNDLMNPAASSRSRELISDFDALMLRDAYGYTISVPSQTETFLASFNRTTGVLTVTGDPDLLTDTIVLGYVDGAVTVAVNDATASFTGVTRVQVNAGAGDDFIMLTDAFADVPVTVNGETGTNYLMGPDLYNAWAITGVNAGNVNGFVTFSNVQGLIGGADTDIFSFADQQRVTGFVDGGGGFMNTLDYSQYSTSVIVSLPLGSATGVAGGAVGAVANIQNVYGGHGGGDAGAFNVLVGTGGNFLIGGWGRRNLLIAGASASFLIGGDGDDLLIGGTTAYDTDLAALTAIMAEWTQATSYEERANNVLSGTGLSPVLDATTVFNNGGGNWHIGNGGGVEQNLYFGLDPALEGYLDWNPDAGEQFILV